MKGLRGLNRIVTYNHLALQCFESHNGSPFLSFSFSPWSIKKLSNPPPPSALFNVASLYRTTFNFKILVKEVKFLCRGRDEHHFTDSRLSFKTGNELFLFRHVKTWHWDSYQFVKGYRKQHIKDEDECGSKLFFLSLCCYDSESQR